MAFASFPVDSEVRCAIICSWDIVCEFYSYEAKQQSCSQYRAPDWPYDAVTFNVTGTVSFKGTRKGRRCLSHYLLACIHKFVETRVTNMYIC